MMNILVYKLLIDLLLESGNIIRKDSTIVVCGDNYFYRTPNNEPDSFHLQMKFGSEFKVQTFDNGSMFERIY